MISRLGSVPVFVSDQDRALAFYRDKLGFEVVFDQRYGPELRWVTVARKKGETEIVLFCPLPAIVGERYDEVKDRIGTWTGIVFITEDIEAAHKTMRERGVEFRTSPTRQGWGGIEAIFFDPDGNSFHLVQRLEPGSP